MTADPIPSPLSPEEGRPGGWVDGIGWVAFADELSVGTYYEVSRRGNKHGPFTLSGFEPDRLVVVVAWPDGNEPTPPTPEPPVEPEEGASDPLMAQRDREWAEWSDSDGSSGEERNRPAPADPVLRDQLEDPFAAVKAKVASARESALPIARGGGPASPWAYHVGYVAALDDVLDLLAASAEGHG